MVAKKETEKLFWKRFKNWMGEGSGGPPWHCLFYIKFGNIFLNSGVFTNRSGAKVF
jgi:hypothetical protein